LILNLFFGPAVNAAYSISMQVNTALNRFVQGFTTALNPQVVKRYSAGDFATFENLVISGSKMSFMLLLFPVFVLMLVTDDVLRLWLGEVPEYSVVFVKLVLLNSLLESMTNSMSTAVQATGRIRAYQVIVGLTLVMNLPLSWVMLRLGLPPATVLVIVIALSLVTLGERVVILKRVVPQISVGKFVRRVFIPLGGVGGISAVVYIVGRCLLLSGRIHPVPAAVAGLLVVALAEYVVGLDSRERAVVRDYICSKIHLA
ncbi:MAG: lipopolysaccharide biosynthesis protein, partial [Muribaculaceae bacterium]|nr:lipopolysaccharide biosynthesis protein [Muribaculaceae bacterium]